MAQFDAFEDGVETDGPVVGPTLAATSDRSFSPETEANGDHHPGIDSDDHPIADGGEHSPRGSWR